MKTTPSTFLSLFLLASGVAGFISLPTSAATGDLSALLHKRQQYNYTELKLYPQLPAPGDKTCRIWGLSATILNDSVMYTDWGFFSLKKNGDVDLDSGSTDGLNSYIFPLAPSAIDLKASGPLDPESIGTILYEGPDSRNVATFPVKFENETSNIYPAWMGGVVWVNKDRTKIVKYGGRGPANLYDGPFYDKGKTRFYELDTGKWEYSLLNAKGTENLLNAEKGVGVAAPEQNLGFYIGGAVWNETDNALAVNQTINYKTVPIQALNSMLIYDFEKNEFTNKTLPNSKFGRTGASAVYVKDIGKRGIIVLMGGIEVDGNLGTTKHKPYTEVEIYDISTDTWYKQRTSGKVPPNTSYACAVVASSSDKTSHNIILTGGRNEVAEETAETYVLSLPSFEWISANYGENVEGRFEHRCVLTSNGKMVNFGGVDNYQMYPGRRGQVYINSGCDKRPYINVFDVSTFTWLDKLDVNDGAKIKVNEKVYSIIGGDENGGATMTKPDANWDNEELGKLFSSSWPTNVNTNGKPKEEGTDAKQTPKKNSGTNTARTPLLLMTLPFMIAVVFA